jgi:hypothetical protein
MSYEPNSQLYDISTIVVLHQLPLNVDVIGEIISFVDPYLNANECIDTFWFKLGRETCNLKEWADNCMSIVYSGFGKSSVYYNCLRAVSNGYPYHRGIAKVQSKLDNMICTYYPVKKKECEANLLRISNLKSIIDIFYNNSECTKYPCEVRSNRRFPKVVHVREKTYILNLITRLRQYKYFIDNYVINEILPREVDQHKELIKYNNGLGKCIDKLEILRDMPVDGD